MITVDNYEVEVCGKRDTITEDLKAIVKYFSDSLLYELDNLILQELKERRDAKNNTSN